MGLTLPVMIRRVQGHSMVPTLPPGTVVYAWRWFQKIRPKKIIIFTRDNKETVKRVNSIEPDGLFVVGDHPETSTDSRQYGVIPESAVRGIVFWPRTGNVSAETVLTENLEPMPRRTDI